MRILLGTASFYPEANGVCTFLQELAPALKAKGHKLTVTGAWTGTSLAAIVLDLRTGVLSAGADPRSEAYAWAR